MQLSRSGPKIGVKLGRERGTQKARRSFVCCCSLSSLVIQQGPARLSSKALDRATSTIMISATATNKYPRIDKATEVDEAPALSPPLMEPAATPLEWNMERLEETCSGDDALMARKAQRAAHAASQAIS